MKILHINTSDIRGGAAQVAYAIHQGCKQAGHESNFFVAHKFSNDEKVWAPQTGPGVGSLSRWSKRLTGRDTPSFIRYSCRDLFRKIRANDIVGFDVKTLISSQAYKTADIVQLHNLHGNYFNLSLLEELSKTKKLVWTLHDMWALTGHCAHSYDCQRWQGGCGQCPYLDTYPPMAWDNTARIFKEKNAIYLSSRLYIVVPSIWLKKKVEKSILKDFPLTHITNGIDTKVFLPREKRVIREELDLPQDKKIITFIAAGGSQGGFKGWSFAEWLIEKYKDRPEVLFLCLGNKQREARIKKDNIIYINYISDQAELAKYYSATDIFLFTSLAENFPLVVLEAMASGTPLVSFGVGGVKEILKHKIHGYIVKYQDKSDLLAGLEWTLEQADLEAIASAAKERVREYFKQEDMQKKYLKLYTQVLS